MILRALALSAALALAAPAAAATRPAAHKPAAPAAKPAPSASVPSGPFDAREPANMAALLAGLGATAQVASHDNDAVLLKVTSPVGAFSVQFSGCKPPGHGCAGFLLDAAAEAKTATIAEINGFNQSSLACRIVQDKANKPHVLYSSLVFASSTRQDMLTHVNAWRGCLADFGAFLKDPPGYLAAAP